MTKPNPKFSIITVCLNAPKLEETCKSIVEQSFQDFEWIVIDGGSDEKTMAIFEKYKYRMNYFVSEKDRGIYNAMNKGIMQAKGEWLNFMNAGDSFAYPKVLAQVDAELMKGKNIDVLYGESIFVYRDKILVSNTPNYLDEYYFYTSTVRHQASFIKKTLFEEFGYYDEDFKIISDWLYFIMLLQKNVKFKRLDRIVVFQDATGISFTEHALNKNERAIGINKMFAGDKIKAFEMIRKGKEMMHSGVILMKKQQIALELRQRIEARG